MYFLDYCKTPHRLSCKDSQVGVLDQYIYITQQPLLF